MPSLPLELFPLVAAVLAGDGDLNTVAMLARVSKEAHRLVTPVLYASIKLQDDSPLLEWLHCMTRAAANDPKDSASSKTLDHLHELEAERVQRIISLFHQVKTVEIRTLRLFPDTKVGSQLPDSFRPFPNLKNLTISQDFIEALGRRKDVLADALIQSGPPPARPPASFRRLIEHSRFFSFLAPSRVTIEGPVEPSDLVHIPKKHDRLEPWISLSLGLALWSLPSLDPNLPPVQLEIRGWRNADFVYGIWEATSKLKSDRDPNQPDDQWWRWKTRLTMLPHIPLDDGGTWQLAMRTVVNVLARMGSIRIPPPGVLEVRHARSEGEGAAESSERQAVQMMQLHMERAIHKGTMFMFYPRVARKMVKLYEGDGGVIPRLPALSFRAA